MSQNFALSSQNRGDQPEILGVALDMDGLLFDTERLYWEVGDEVLRRRGKRYCKSLQQRMMGRIGLNAIAQMIDFHQLPDSAEDLMEESDQLYQQKLATDIQPMPELNNWIDALTASQIPFGLATSSRRKFVDTIFAEISWRDQLDFILTGDDVQNGKPHPEMYLAAASKLRIDPRKMLVLEDSQNGCVAALAAEAITIAIPSEHTRQQDFTGVYLVADSLGDRRLLSLLNTAR